ncbi:MAG TPA: alkaline phosphatase D family protein [Gemmatimonadaceae bacterium]|nr:alkaline phosphatase D family protein [Gemmatimonadaceae bacterium]
MDRRAFINDLARYSALAATTPNIWRLRWHPNFADDPFQLGVASGDPTPSGAVLWTRLAPQPADERGGMGDQRVVVRWEVAEDQSFTRITKSGRATATPEIAHSIHVDVDGLRPDSWYFYRFIAGDAVSDTGRLRTTPPDGAESPLRFAFASCQHYEQGLYTSIEHLAAEDIELGVHLGDYIYERGPSANAVRKHVGVAEVNSISDYRLRYGQYKSDPALRAMHARCPWVVIWDDHEVDNNYATLINEDTTMTLDTMRARRAAGYQAWWEHMPVRVSRARNWLDLKIYRSTNWGRLARFWAVDDRQYRSDQACGDGSKAIPCGDWDSPKRAMLGSTQEKWLVDGLGRSNSRWQVLAQQVVFAPPDEQPKAGDRVDMDKWSGYPAERDRILAAIAERARNRTVILTGDIHNNWVYDVRRGFDATDRPIVAAEFVGTSLSSGGDGADTIARINDAYLASHPSLKWANNRRGYVVCELNRDEWVAKYRTVDYVSRPGALVKTAAAWRTEHGRPGVTRIA